MVAEQFLSRVVAVSTRMPVSFGAMARQIVLAGGLIAAVSAPAAYANNSAATDIVAPVHAAQAANAQASGDQEFHQLFSAWRAMDQGSGFAASSSGGFGTQGSLGGALTGTAVAIPSRLPLDSIRMTSDFGMRWHPVLGGMREHDGVDLGAPVGTPIYATADGVVGRASWFGGYGLCVELEHGGDLETRYGHMSRLNVAPGQMVHKGDVIGFVGATGRTTGPHLHYEVRIAGAAVNPLPYMQGAVTTLAMAGSTRTVSSGGVTGPAMNGQTMNAAPIPNAGTTASEDSGD